MKVVDAGAVTDIPAGQAIRVVAGDVPIAIFNVHGQLYAIGDTCTHEEFSLSDGELVDVYTVECPLHGAQFDVRTGNALCLPATLPAGSFRVWVEGDTVKVEVPD